MDATKESDWKYQGDLLMACLNKVSEFIKRVYGVEGATPPTLQTKTRQFRIGNLPADQKGKLWYINCELYQKQTGDDLMDKVLLG